MARKSKKDKNQELLATAMANFELSYEYFKEQRELWVEDYEFAQVVGAQTTDRYGSGSTDRPKLEVNKIRTAINQIVGEYRQNDLSAKVRPENDSSAELANTFNGLIRNLQNSSNARSAHNIAFDQEVTAGMGAWRVGSMFSNDDGFDQDITITPIHSAGTTVYPDPSSKAPHHKEGMWLHVIDDMSRESFKSKYPDSQIASFDDGDDFTSACRNGWASTDSIRISEYFFKKEIKATMLLMSDGSIYDEQEVMPVLDELKDKGVEVVRSRQVKKHKVFRALMSGAEILEEPSEWAGSIIPVIICYGFNQYIGKQFHTKGVTRDAKDANMLYNWAISTSYESLALAPKDPWLATPKMIGKYQVQWENQHNTNTQVLLYDPDPDSPTGKPERAGPPALSPALVDFQRQADLDIQSALGNFTASQQQTRAQQSGDAITANQRQGDLNTYTLLDNIASAVAFEGEILVDLIPKIYDIERQLRIMKPDGETEMVTVNKEEIDFDTRKKTILNDLSNAKMGIYVDVGPTYQSQRTENINILTRLSESNPEVGASITDLIAKNIDFPDSDELKARTRRLMINNGHVDPTEEEILQAQKKAQRNPPPPPSPQEQAAFESQILSNESVAAGIDNINAQTLVSQQEAKNLSAAAAQKEAEAAETVRSIQLQNSKLIEDLKKMSSDRSNKDADTLDKIVSTINQKIEKGMPVTADDLRIMEGSQIVLEEAQTDQLQQQIKESTDNLK